MTASQASYLKTLAEQADDPDAYSDELSKADASKKIDELREKLNLPRGLSGRKEGPPPQEGESGDGELSASGQLVERSPPAPSEYRAPPLVPVLARRSIFR